MTDDRRHVTDVVVIGAGLAGIAAAAALRAVGLEVTVLEARNRLGGRGFCRPFGRGDQRLDFGGSWITPWQHRIRALCAEHGIELRPRAPVSERRWFRDGALHVDGPVAADERERHDDVIARIATDAALPTVELEPLSLTAYLDGLGALTATRDLVGAWWALSGSADPTAVSVTELLSSCAHGDGTPDGICLAWADTLVGGAGELAHRMIAASGADLRLSTPARTVTQRGAEVLVACDTVSLVASGAVVATGINPLRALAFDPPLSPEKQAALETGNLGRAVKVWARVRNVPVGSLATGGGSGIEWMLAEREAPDDTTMLVGFGVAVQPFDVAAATRQAVERFFPEADLLEVDWHDWIGDPWARGTWMAAAIGSGPAFAAGSWEPEGRVAFATSDVAPDEVGWFEGAIRSGELAAASLATQLGMG